MNQVSWLIYLSNVSGNMGSFFAWIGAACIIGGAAFFIASYVMLDVVNSWSEDAEKKAAIKVFKNQRATSVFCMCSSFFFFFCGSLMPSQNTVLAIAASQFGEQMLHTKTVTLAEQALNSWLQKQITKVEVPAPAEKK